MLHIKTKYKLGRTILACTEC